MNKLNQDCIATTVSQEEIEKFNALANQWWDPNGDFRLLHKMNPVRLKFIKDIINKVYGTSVDKLSVLDIGCGGGLVSLPLSKLGAQVLGIDMSEKNVKIARAKAHSENLEAQFRVSAVEDLGKEKFDLILALEVIEHVEDVELFLSNISRICKSNGLVVLSSINRTVKSWLLAKVAAEYLFRIVPIGTHDADKFISPDEVTEIMELNEFSLVQNNGLALNPILQTWSLTNNTSVNYICAYQKQ